MVTPPKPTPDMGRAGSRGTVAREALQFALRGFLLVWLSRAVLVLVRAGPRCPGGSGLGRAIFWNLLELAKATARALGAWRVAMVMSFPLPPVAVGTPTVAASPMGTWLPVRQGARLVPRPSGLPPPAADVNVVVMEPFLLGAVSQGTVLAEITLVRLFCCQLPRVVVCVPRARWLASLALLPRKAWSRWPRPGWIAPRRLRAALTTRLLTADRNFFRKVMEVRVPQALRVASMAPWPM